MGVGRSGTSLMGGILHRAGYFLGDDLYPARDTNPLGFFECDLINGINEEILKNVNSFSDPDAIIPRIKLPFSPYRPGYGQRWLSLIPPQTNFKQTNKEIEAKIVQALSHPVFAYKDPRFNYTVEVWSKFFPSEVILICMFRQPDKVVESILKECSVSDYLANFYIDADIAYQIWFNNYEHILKSVYPIFSRQMVFVNYEQLLNKQMLPLLSEKLEAVLDSGQIVPELNRTKAVYPPPEKVFSLYKTLCEHSGFQMNVS